ncbi:MAG: hypothetical protein ACK559_07040, partial [bacterium]
GQPLAPLHHLRGDAAVAGLVGREHRPGPQEQQVHRDERGRGGHDRASGGHRRARIAVARDTLRPTEVTRMPIAPLAIAALLAAAPDAPAPGTSLTVYSSADPAGFDPRQFVQQQRASGMDNVWGVPG